jgi:hypothetical protein
MMGLVNHQNILLVLLFETTLRGVVSLSRRTVPQRAPRNNSLLAPSRHAALQRRDLLPCSSDAEHTVSSTGELLRGKVRI